MSKVAPGASGATLLAVAGCTTAVLLCLALLHLLAPIFELAGQRSLPAPERTPKVVEEESAGNWLLFNQYQSSEMLSNKNQTRDEQELEEASSVDSSKGELAWLDPFESFKEVLGDASESSGSAWSPEGRNESGPGSGPGSGSGSAAEGVSIRSTTANGENKKVKSRTRRQIKGRRRRATVSGSVSSSSLKLEKEKEEKFVLLRKRRRLERRPILNEFSFPANLVQGMKFVLMCQVLDSGDSPVNIKWLKDNQEILIGPDSSPSILKTSLGTSEQATGNLNQVELVANEELGALSLVFRKVQQQHSGNYTCLASNHFGSSAFSSFMSVKVPPSWRIEPQDQESIIGEQITINCQASGNPNPFIRWKFASFQQQLANVAHLGQIQTQTQTGATSTDQRISGSSSLLDLSALQLDLSAPTGQQFHSPTNQFQTQTQTQTQGPAQSQQIFKLINSNHHVQSLENGSLSIRQANKEHEGLYLCEADNGVEPNLVKVVRLVVHLQAQFADDIQVIQEAEPGGGNVKQAGQQHQTPVRTQAGLKSARVVQNATQLRLLCQMFGDQPLSLDWLKDGQLIYTHSTSSDLSSAASTSASSSSVSSSLNHLSVGEQVLNSLSSLQAVRYHVNTRPSATRPQTGLDSELVIMNVRRSDAAVFSCVARNAFGQNERKLRLVVQEPPEPPEVVDVAHIASRSISLRWLAPFDGNSPILKYIVEYRKHPTSDTTSLSSQFTGQSEKIVMASKSSMEQQQQPQQAQAQLQQQIQHTVHELEPLARYSMRVVAVNSVGNSKPSVALSLRTEEEVPSVVPSMVEATVLSSKSIKLHWTISYSPEREIIDGFFVGYRSFDTSSLLQEVQSVGVLKSANSINNQASKQQQPSSQLLSEPTFTYKTIRLTNQPRIESGQQSNNAYQQQQTIEAHNARQQQQQQQQDASAFLLPVSSITKNLPTQASNHQTMQQQQVVVVSTFEYLIGGLDRNTEYTILIQCFNQKGAGPTSDPVVFKTFTNDPPEKLALSADEITESSVRVNWRFLNEHSIQALSSSRHQDETLVDGFVLTFAKLEQKAKSKSLLGSGANKSSDSQLMNRSNGPNQVNQAALRISNLTPAQTQASLPNQGLEQWQATQLAPQQRSHQLKNLECGTSYAIKIWAFNKIGKGEPSDLFTVSTRGKAPVAPDRRSFISSNSTQVRLHLSAWYNGGCEIDKFVIQYRVRGQQEWILVSNNILKEQVSVVIRDLLPATSYELFVSAQNQVGPTEVKYRFTTLDSNGKQVSAGHSFLNPSDENEDLLDYSDFDSGGVRRELWPGSNSDSPYNNSLMMFRQLLNSPIALTFSLCLFLALVLLLIFYKFQGSSNLSNETFSASHKSLSSSGTNRRHAGAGGETNATILDSTEGALSVAESPRANYQSHRLLPSESPFPASAASECSHYQAFCSADTNQLRQQPVEYATRSMDVPVNADCSPYVPAYGQLNNYASGAYANVQRSATMNAGLGLALGQPDVQDQQRQQQCLVQMLMMGPQQQQQQQQLDASGNNAGLTVPDNNSYMAAALTTLARNKNNAKLTNQQLYTNHAFQNGANLTLNRQLSDYQRLQQQQANSLGHYSGKATITTTTVEGTNKNRQQSNNLSMATNNKQQNIRSDELYPMSTFKQPQQHNSLSLVVASSPTSAEAQLQSFSNPQYNNNYCSSASTASTSGCGTTTSGASNLMSSDNEQATTLLISSDGGKPTGQLESDLNNHLLPYIDSSSNQEQLIDSSSHNFSSQDVGELVDCVNRKKTCDKTSQYDVPFKFFKPANNTVMLDKMAT